MKKLGWIILMIVGCFFCQQPALAASPKKVAVYVEGNISNSQKSMINSAVMSRISSSKDYVCFERNENFLKALTKEEDYQTGGDVPDREIREVGMKAGADFVIIIDVRTSYDTMYMAAKLIELQSGKVIKTVDGTREGNDMKTIKALASNCTYRLISAKSK